MNMQSALDRAERPAPPGTYAFHVGDEHFWLHVAEGHSTLRDGTLPYPADATITVTRRDFYELANGTHVDDLPAVIDGDRDRLIRLFETFCIPSAGE